MKLVIEEAAFEELRRQADRAEALAAGAVAHVEGRSALARTRAGGRLSGTARAPRARRRHLAAALERMGDGELGFCWDVDLRAAAEAEDLSVFPE